jgi:hypothetical protein
MATVPTASYDETKPAGTRDVNLGDDDIRELKTQLREIIAADHSMSSSGQGATWGAHNIVRLLVQTSITALADAGLIYSKDVAGKAELHYKDEDGNEVQITSGGKILGDNVRLSNNTNLTAKDAAGTGTVNLIKANASDKAELPVTAVLSASTAPTVDAGIANKKYVDDNISPVGSVVQVVNTQTGAYILCDGDIPFDDTKPEITEGVEVMTLAITPKSATNKLLITVTFMGRTVSSAIVVGSLFNPDFDATYSLASGFEYENSADLCVTFSRFITTTLPTTATTFSVRIGSQAGSDFYFNGKETGRAYGGACASSITITEIKA